MKKYFYLAAVLPMLLLASCEKEATVNTLNATATIAGDNDTKTTYTDNGEDTQSALRVSWSDAESFKAYYSSTEYVTFSKTSGNTFTAADVPAGVTSATQFTGVYGTKAAYNSDGTVSIDFSGQDGSLENLSKYDVMTCISTTEAGALKFAFEHKCAIIRVKLTSTNAASANQNHLCIKLCQQRFIQFVQRDCRFLQCRRNQFYRRGPQVGRLLLWTNHIRSNQNDLRGSPSDGI